jgi:hypothetical protein
LSESPPALPLLHNGGLDRDFGGESSSKARVADNLGSAGTVQSHIAAAQCGWSSSRERSRILPKVKSREPGGREIDGLPVGVAEGGLGPEGLVGRRVDGREFFPEHGQSESSPRLLLT